MPTLLTRKIEEGLTQELPCNFSDPSQNAFDYQQISVEELRARCERYRQLLASLQPSQENNMLQAANFTVESVQRLIGLNPDSAFIRVYYGITENGEHRLFMGAVTETTSLAAEEDTLYVDDCCACPPRLNCQDDELLP